jgi:hypothetical protein
VRDDDKYRIIDVNKDMARVYRGTHIVGHVRRGLDHLWYPELPAHKYKGAAIQAVLLADQAIDEYVKPLTDYVGSVDGDR